MPIIHHYAFFEISTVLIFSNDTGFGAWTQKWWRKGQTNFTPSSAKLTENWNIIIFLIDEYIFSFYVKSDNRAAIYRLKTSKIKKTLPP